VDGFLTSILTNKNLLPNFWNKGNLVPRVCLRTGILWERDWNKGPSFQISISNLQTGALYLTKLGNSLRPADELAEGYC
jgi:hypothetical protein